MQLQFDAVAGVAVCLTMHRYRRKEFEVLKVITIGINNIDRAFAKADDSVRRPQPHLVDLPAASIKDIIPRNRVARCS